MVNESPESQQRRQRCGLVRSSYGGLNTDSKTISGHGCSGQGSGGKRKAWFAFQRISCIMLIAKTC